ncbi:hypothetical protein BWI17_01805 [Betaproteobacteria bacterium GR16-43]|nr:hypothetical protein BWI17_01805 [Betaproteobacteria bacterium GR16-43]
MRTLSRVIAALACIVALEADAGISFLAGSTPQRAQAGQPFQPIAFLLTDSAGAPRPGATVRYSFLSTLVRMDSFAGCFYDLGWNCTTTTDPQGIARLHGFIAVTASTQVANISVATAIGEPFEGKTAQLFVDPAGPVKVLTPVAGMDQHAPVGVAFAQPFAVRVTNADGLPASGVPVLFSRVDGPSIEFLGNVEGTALSDAGGNAAMAAVATMGIGPGTLRATIYDTAAGAYVTTDIAFRTTTPDGRTDRELEDMWWSGFQENGWGISIAQRFDRLFPVLYVYDANGNPTWQVIESGGWASNARYERYIGFRYSPRGSPYYAYDVTKFDIGAKGTAVDFNFTSEVTATMDILSRTPTPLNSKKLVRQDFRGDTPAPLVGIGGMWWGGPSQGGWGISLMQQAGGLFAVWFTYDANGDRTWFVMPEGRWENSNTYSGTLFKTKSASWFGSEYDASKFEIFPVGTYRFRFTDLDHGKFEYSAEGHTGTMAIERQLF